jgi:hypothetical protein
MSILEKVKKVSGTRTLVSKSHGGDLQKETSSYIRLKFKAIFYLGVWHKGAIITMHTRLIVQEEIFYMTLKTLGSNLTFESEARVIPTVSAELSLFAFSMVRVWQNVGLDNCFISFLFGKLNKSIANCRVN